MCSQYREKKCLHDSLFPNSLLRLEKSVILLQEYMVPHMRHLTVINNTAYLYTKMGINKLYKISRTQEVDKCDLREFKRL